MYPDSRPTLFEHLLEGGAEPYIEPHVRNRVVHDLGCGNLRYAPMLLGLGVKKVVGIDRHSFQGCSAIKHPQVEFYQKRFHEVTEAIDVAFVSWPVNWVTGLHLLVQRAHTVIYIGKNTDGTVCAEENFWTVLRSRPVLAHVPDKKETLIVYGPGYVERDLLPEEYAALHLETVWGFEAILKFCDDEPSPENPETKPP